MFMFLRAAAPLRKGMLRVAVAGLACTFPALAQSQQITANNWGSVTSPVFGLMETGAFADAELFAGPRKFAGMGDGDYYHGVLPNGRIVRPIGTSVQVGMNPLGLALTPDSRFLITSNDDERGASRATGVGLPSFQSDTINVGGYSLSVLAIDAKSGSMNLASQIATSRYFVGLQIKRDGLNYAVYASGGPDTEDERGYNTIRLYTIDGKTGQITERKTSGPASKPFIAIAPITPLASGFVSNYKPKPEFYGRDKAGKPNPTPLPAPSGFLGADLSKTGHAGEGGDHLTFPAGSALSPDGRYLYVACNGDNSLAVIDTASNVVIKQIPVGYFPYGVVVSANGQRVFVSNWGVTEYKFIAAQYQGDTLTDLKPTPDNLPDGFYVPKTDTGGKFPKTSSITVLSVPDGDATRITADTAWYQGKPLDALHQVGDTHPSALGIVRRSTLEVLYIAKANSDSIGMVRLDTNRRLADFDLSPVDIKLKDGHKVHGAYPNALVVSSDSTRVYVAEAGLNSVAVLDTTDPLHPRLLGRLPTGWYPTGLALSDNDRTLYVSNAKGIGPDFAPKSDSPMSVSSVDGTILFDSNFQFGSVQQIDLRDPKNSPDLTTAAGYNYAFHTPEETQVVPLGGKASRKIKHVFFILHENKTFDSMLGSLKHFGGYADMTFRKADGAPDNDPQYTGVSRNLQTLAGAFATGVNYYSDSDESDAGHQYAASGTASDYTEKTLVVKSGRGLLVNKNFEPEDYPEGGYLFNNAARNRVSFKVYGDMLRVEGTDTGESVPTLLNDPTSGLVGYPQMRVDAAGKPTRNLKIPLTNEGDVNSATKGAGQSYFIKLPMLAVLGGKNANGEARLDRNYPGYNFNISDQRRAKEFIKDFDRMAARGVVPQMLTIYQPNDHTGGVVAPNAGNVMQRDAATRTSVSPFQQVADGDVALGMVVQHIMNSPLYYNPATGEGSAIFITFDDAQASLDHINPHRTPLVVVSPYSHVTGPGVASGYLGKRHYVTASIVKTEELLLGLPPNNLGDLFATDLRDLFQPTYNGIKAGDLQFTHQVTYTASAEGQRIWSLASRLDTSAPDRDSARLGALARLSGKADRLNREATRQGSVRTVAYRKIQNQLYQNALAVVSTPARDND